MSTSADDGWEARMAARARARARWTWRSSDEQAAQAARAYIREHDAQMREHNAGMTLGQALAYLQAEPFGCACIGGPRCCVGVHRQATALVRAAWTAATLMAATRDRR